MRILSLTLKNQTLFIGRTVNHVFYFGGRVAPVCTGVNSKNRVGAYLTTRNGPQRTAATLCVTLLSYPISTTQGTFPSGGLFGVFLRRRKLELSLASLTGLRLPFCQVFGSVHLLF